MLSEKEIVEVIKQEVRMYDTGYSETITYINIKNIAKAIIEKEKEKGK